MGHPKARRLLITALALTAGWFAFVQRAEAQTKDELEWMGENVGAIADALMPPRTTIGPHVTYRSYRELYTDELEYWFALGYDPNENSSGLQRDLSAHVRIADSVSIYDQVLRLHRADPTATASDIQGLVKLKKWDFTERTCPIIKQQFEKFQRVRFGPPRFDQIVFEPLYHDFSIETTAGTMQLSLVDDQDPLVRWALQTREALNRCANFHEGEAGKQ